MNGIANEIALVIIVSFAVGTAFGWFARMLWLRVVIPNKPIHASLPSMRQAIGRGIRRGLGESDDDLLKRAREAQAAFENAPQ